jgi:hypothetical protein
MKRSEYRFFYIFTSQQIIFKKIKPPNPISQTMNTGEILIYQTKEGTVKLSVTYKDDNFWLSQKLIAQLFGVEVPAISKHLKNIFESGELDENSVVSKMETTASDNKSYLTTFYNLDAIIAVGYRVNSKQATQFRIWATQTLKEFIIKGLS